MTGQCCIVRPASHRLSRRLSGTAASLVPAALLVLLPKCPLCLAAWLTVATGIGFSPAGAAWLRGSLLVFWIAAFAVVVRRYVSVLRREPSHRTPG
jgi:hypothetical protein